MAASIDLTQGISVPVALEKHRRRHIVIQVAAHWKRSSYNIGRMKAIS